MCKTQKGNKEKIYMNCIKNSENIFVFSYNNRIANLNTPSYFFVPITLAKIQKLDNIDYWQARI